MTFQPLPAQLLVIAKAPVAGLVKTRLCPPYTALEAAELAAAALADTVEAVSAAPVQRRVLILDGRCLNGPPPGWDVLLQRGVGLAERLAAAYQDAWEGCRLPLLLIGMDTPHVTSGLLGDAVGLLLKEGTDAVLGPAADGGWWAMGLRRPNPALLRGVPMSTPGTGAHQADRLRLAGLRVGLLPVLTDVDTAADVAEVAAAAPASRFAATVARLELLDQKAARPDAPSATGSPPVTTPRGLRPPLSLTLNAATPPVPRRSR